MKLTKLNLTRYGHFTDFLLELGNDPEGPYFHIIFGENETGKSTIRDAFIDFLYGIPARTPYNFLHENSALEVGATLSIGDEEHRLIRRKRNTNDLLDAQENPISQNILKAALGDISRDGYCNMFSLDEDTLIQGGKNILKSEGDLGQLLFSAAAGITGLSKTLEEIRKESENYYKHSGRKHELAQLKKELVDLETTIRELDVQAHHYEKLFKDEAQAREAYEDASKEKAENAKRNSELKATLDALSPWRSYLKTRDNLAECEDSPALPDGWLEEAEALRPKDSEVRSSCTRLSKELEDIEAQLEGIVVNETFLKNGEAIDRLQADDLEARYKAAKDIANRERERNGLQDVQKRNFRSLGREEGDEANKFLLPAATIADLRDLISGRSGVAAKRESAHDEYERAKVERDKAKSTLSSFSELADLMKFSRRVDALRSTANEEDLDKLKRAQESANAESDEALALLTPWSGTPEELTACDVPSPSVITALTTRKKNTDDAIRDGSREKERLDDEEASLIATSGVTKGAVADIDDETAKRAHDFRNERWAEHKKLIVSGASLDPKSISDTAGTFETTMEEDDRVRDLRLRASTELAAYRETKIALERNSAASKRQQEKRVAIDLEAGEVQSKIEKILGGLALPSDIAFDDLPKWIDRRAQALQRYRAQCLAKNEFETAETAIKTAKAKLTKELGKLDVDCDDYSGREILALCDEVIDEWREQTANKKAAVENLETAEQDVEERKSRFDTADADWGKWLSNWEQTLKGCWMGEAEAELTTAAVTENLRVLDEISSTLRELAELDSRIAAMEDDREAYRAEICRLTEATDYETKSDDPLRIADELRLQLQSARRNHERSEEMRGVAKDKETALREAQGNQAEINDHFKEFSAVFQAESFDELISAMRRSEKRASLSDELELQAETLCGMLSASDIETVEAQISPVALSPEKSGDLRAEHELLTVQQSAEEKNVQELYSNCKDTERALAAVGGDSEVARLEEQKQGLYLEIQHKSDAFLRRTAGVKVIQHAITRYRDTHRSSMMDQASKAFALITRGGFAELKALADDDQEVLVGIKRNGSSLVASKMSRGTRFQLYLALRVAGHTEFTKHRESLPFFADDILEPFDNPRSKETFSLMNDLSKSGQVIYLTHHEHLCDLARKVCGDRVNIIELPDHK